MIIHRTRDWIRFYPELVENPLVCIDVQFWNAPSRRVVSLNLPGLVALAARPVGFALPGAARLRGRTESGGEGVRSQGSGISLTPDH